MIDFKKYKVTELPDCAYYIPNFVTPEEESALREKVYSSPKPKWKSLSNRRLQNWGGLPHAKGMIQEDLPEWLLGCVRQVVSLGVFPEERAPNHVLVNEYLPGQGIMPHEDGPLFHPTIATLSLGSHTVLDYYEKQGGPVGSLLLEPRSLLLVQGALYAGHLHGIQEKFSDVLGPSVCNLAACGLREGAEVGRGTRLSLTIRHVPHTLKAKLIFGKKY